MYGFVDCCVYSVIFVLFTKLFPLQVTGEMGGDVKTCHVPKIVPVKATDAVSVKKLCGQETKNSDT